MRPSTWADRLLALLVRFVGLVILLATLVAAAASFLYNQAEESDQAARVAAQFNMRLRDHVAILEGVRALYQSSDAADGTGDFGDQRVLVGGFVQLVDSEAFGEGLFATIEKLVGLQNLYGHASSLFLS